MHRILIAILLLCSTVSAQSIGGLAYGNSPLPPGRWMGTLLNATNFPGLGSNTNVTVCAAGCTYTTLQNAENAISCNTNVIIRSEDLGYEQDLGDSQFIALKHHCTPGNEIWIQPSELSMLPGQDTDTMNCPMESGQPFACAINASNHPHMWKIKKTTVSNTNDFAFLICGTASNAGCPGLAQPASGYIISGLDFQWTGAQTLLQGIVIGWLFDTSPVTDIVFDRLSIDTTTGAYGTQLVAAMLNFGGYVAVTDSYCAHVWIQNGTGGNQSQCFEDYTSTGPIKLFNDALGGATTENVEFGGSPTRALGCPYDIEARRNLLWKDPSKFHNDPSGAVISNEFEEKGCALRSWIEGNIILYSFFDSNYYFGFASLTSFKEDQNPPPVTPFDQLSDVHFCNNIAAHGAVPFGVFGHNTNGVGYTYPGTARIEFCNNLFLELSWTAWSDTHYQKRGIDFTSGGTQVGFLPPNMGTPGPEGVQIISNAFFESPGGNMSWSYIDTPPPGIGCPGGTYYWPTVIPAMQMQQNAIVSAIGYLFGDCYPTTAQMLSAGVFPQLNAGTSGSANNILFGWTRTGGDTCDGWSPYNIGICPMGTSSTPSTINTTMGLADYANCAAATGTVAQILAHCRQTGIPTDMTAAPSANVDAIAAAMALSEDAVINGVPRTTH